MGIEGDLGYCSRWSVSEDTIQKNKRRHMFRFFKCCWQDQILLHNYVDFVLGYHS